LLKSNDFGIAKYCPFSLICHVLLKR
jgi:hypothetical protein